jgi:CDP-2,3-bis-(O-geranylgeranyl)-sn-glycerol synthase
MYLKVSNNVTSMVDFVQLFYLMIPAYVANMAPVFVRKFPWSAPVDFGTGLLGSHKTWRGFIAGVSAALIVGTVMSHVYWPFGFSGIKWGLAAGFGALLGDSVKSFFKRRLNISPGKPWIPFDQIDYSIGAIALGSFVFFTGWLNALIIIIVSSAGHIIVNHIGYYLGIREVKW